MSTYFIAGPNLVNQSKGDFHVFLSTNEKYRKAQSRKDKAFNKGNLMQVEAETVQEIVEYVYSDQIEESGSDWASYVSEFNWVDQPTMNLDEKQVDRNTPADGELIYEVKKVRKTGAHVILVNKVSATGKRTYGARCNTHKHTASFDKRLPAEAECHHPENWCNGCAKIAEEA